MAMKGNTTAGPLAGLTVVDASWGMPAALAGMMLADYGAEIIKIERPSFESVRAGNLRKTTDRGKRSITVDLAMDSGRDEVLGLVQQADIFIESFGLGGAASRGLGYEDLKEINPRLVYVSFTGYGEDTPLSEKPGYEALLNAYMGMTAEQRAHRDGPIFLGHPTVSYGTAFIAVIGTLAALQARHHTGRGQKVSPSLLDGMLTLASMNWWWNEKDISYLERSGPTLGFGRKRLITDPFQCADGKWLTPHTGGPGSYKKMMDLLGFGDKVQAVDGPEMAVPLNDVEYEIARIHVPAVFRTRSRDEWVRLFAENDIACLPVLRPEEIFQDDQVMYSGIGIDLPDDEHGIVRQVGPVIHFERTPPATPTPAPAVGQDNDTYALCNGVIPKNAQMRENTGALESALKGLSIVDFSSFFATGFGAKLLCDLGADVIKVEPPVGDQMRPLGDLWEASQRGKKSIALDLRTPDGQRVAHKLVEEADVVLINFRPGKAEKIGLGYETLSSLNPRLIYAYLPGFGSKGPKSTLKSFAPLQSGLVGMGFIGAGKDNPPIRRVMGNEDLYNGFLGAVGVLMAVHARQKSGIGQYIESPQLHSSLFVRTEFATDDLGRPVFAHELDADQMGWSPVYRLYETSDGWLMLAAVGDRHFSNLCRALGRNDLLNEPRFSSWSRRHDYAEELSNTLEAEFASRPTDGVFALLNEHGVPVEIPKDSPMMPDLLWEEWAVDTGRVVEHRHPEYGWCREVGITIRLSDTPGKVRSFSPLLGEHTREILLDAGFSAAEVHELISQGVAKTSEAVTINFIGDER